MIEYKELLKQVKTSSTIVRKAPMESSPAIISLKVGIHVTIEQKRWEWVLVAGSTDDGDDFRGWVRYDELAAVPT